MKSNRKQKVQGTLRIEFNDIFELELRSKRERKETNSRDDFDTFLVVEDLRSDKVAITSLDATFWKEALYNEIESIIDNHT